MSGFSAICCDSVWWEKISAYFLDDCLGHINTSMHEDDPAKRCTALFHALNKTWDAFHFYSKKTGTADPRDRSDYREILDLFTLGLTAEDSILFSGWRELSELAQLTPQVMNHQTLKEADYEPGNNSAQLAQKARREHRQFLNAYERYISSADKTELLKPMLQKLAHLLYIVRNNSAHGERSTHGPDLDKAKRDAAICLVTAPVISRFFDVLFRSPNNRFAAYGTLRPGECNHRLIEKLGNNWVSGSVRGTLTEHNGFLQLVWNNSGEKVKVEVLNSAKLPDKFDTLDSFEGRDYQRILVPVEIQGHIEICNLYAKAPR
jgi:gamma-glutamylcyclotransferase (GGCT)/AIG2-like uncharacterized protein YtfP